jgi:hypothetical protein
MPALPRDVVDEVCTQIVLQLFHLSAEFIGEDADVNEEDNANANANVARRDALVSYAERFVVRLFAGAMSLARHEEVQAAISKRA